MEFFIVVGFVGSGTDPTGDNERRSREDGISASVANNLIANEIKQAPCSSSTLIDKDNEVR